MKLSSNTMLLIAAGVVVLGGLYWFFFTGSNTNQPPLTAGSAQSAAQTRFQVLAGQLSPITFDTSIFNDPRFSSLVNLATPVAPEPTGRTDPFAQIPGVSAQ